MYKTNGSNISESDFVYIHFLNFFGFIYFMCMRFCLHMCMCTTCVILLLVEVKRVWDSLVREEANSGPVEEQQVLLTTELYLQLQFHAYRMSRQRRNEVRDDILCRWVCLHKHFLKSCITRLSMVGCLENEVGGQECKRTKWSLCNLEIITKSINYYFIKIIIILH